MTHTENISPRKYKQIQNVIQLLRPVQWSKNIFVFTGVIFGKAFDSPALLLAAIFCSIAFSLVSSCIYIFNDIVDCKSDQLHPQKKNRPIASGVISSQLAAKVSLSLFLLGASIGYFVSLQTFIILTTYVFLNIFYTLKLKHVVILDVFCISSGFMLRILAGTVGIGIAPSKWLLLCGMMITLFLGFSKRRAEIIALGEGKQNHRKVLEHYGATFLDEMIAICATSVIVGYSLYTMSSETIATHQTDNLIYTVPFVIYAIFRYIYILHHGNSAGDPSIDLFKDKHIIVSVCGWIIASVCILSSRGL